MNFAGFEPVAAERGLPGDVAPQTAELAARWPYFSPTWVSWAEIAAVDWSLPTDLGPSARLSTAMPAGYPRRIQYPFTDASTSFASCLSFARLCC
jgi:hypothetical protein